MTDAYADIYVAINDGGDVSAIFATRDKMDAWLSKRAEPYRLFVCRNDTELEEITPEPEPAPELPAVPGVGSA